MCHFRHIYWLDFRIAQERRERPSTALVAIDAPPPRMIYFAPNMRDEDYSDDEFVAYEKRRQRGRRNFCIGVIVFALVALGAMLVLWK